MTPSQPSLPNLQSWRFLVLYALAAAGGSASYAPFLTLLLPVHVDAVWQGGAIEVLAYAAFTGAVAASLANIFFGWISDRSDRRREWIVVGAILSGVILVAMQSAATIAGLLMLIVLWQSSVNMMLAPLSAWAGDCVPDEQKGTLGGLLSVAPAVGALVGALVTVPGLADGGMRLGLVAVLVPMMVLPVVFFGKPRPMPHLMERRTAAPMRTHDNGNAPVVRMWLSRLLIQIAESALFAYLLLWITGLEPATTDNDIAKLFTLVLIVSVPLAMLVGRWSDRRGRPILPLILTAGGGTVGLIIMGSADNIAIGIAGYTLFGVLAAVFLSLHASQTLRVLPNPYSRGRDLGIFNLTNTVPSLIMPWLTLSLVPIFGFDALFYLLAAFAVLSCLLLATIRKV